MKTRLLLGLSSFIMLFLSSQEETAFPSDTVSQEHAKLKRILHFETVHSEAPIRIVEEYVYNEEDKIRN